LFKKNLSKKVAEKRKKKKYLMGRGLACLPCAGVCGTPFSRRQQAAYRRPRENLPHLSEEASYWARLDCAPGSQAHIFILYW
jgi:hypothetical protein